MTSADWTWTTAVILVVVGVAVLGWGYAVWLILGAAGFVVTMDVV